VDFLAIQTETGISKLHGSSLLNSPDRRRRERVLDARTLALSSPPIESIAALRIVRAIQARVRLMTARTIP